MNYYELFGIPVAPVVDRALVPGKYFELQRSNHPDFHTLATEEEQAVALKQSSDINKAFSIFQDKEKNIEYFLQIKGLIEHDEKYNLPQDFLMEMMEINEAISEDITTNARRQVEEYEQQLFKEIEPILQRYDPVETPNEDLLKLKDYHYKKKYLNRILDRLGD